VNGIFGFRNVNSTIWFEETLQPGVFVSTRFDKPEQLRLPDKKTWSFFASRIELGSVC